MRQLASTRVIRLALASAVAAPWIVWALLRLLGLDGIYPLAPAMAFTPYVVATSPVPVLFALALKRRIVIAVSGVTALALATTLAPRAVAGGQPQPTGPHLTVMTANLRLGHADPKTVVRLIRRYHVDVLALEELTPEELQRLDDAGLARRLPGRVAQPLAHAAGSGVFAARRLTPIPEVNPGPHPEPEGQLRLPGAPALLLKAVHPIPPDHWGSVGTWRRTLDALPPAARPDIRILAGDFNATLDHAELRGVLDRGYADAAERAGTGLHATWPALGVHHALPITIDHVLVDRRVRVLSVHVEHLPGSDHRAVVAELVLPRQ
jgi:endonuclease/exonuclease/phosphatase (EEP) superfamily protein YafD